MSPPARYADLIERTALAYGLDRDLLTGQVQVESGFDTFALRYEKGFFTRYLKDHPEAKGYVYGPLAACSYGLLQILGETALELGYDEPLHHLFQPDLGLLWGAKYLQKCLKRTKGDYRTALAAYNGAGPAAVFYAEKVYAAAGRA